MKAELHYNSFLYTNSTTVSVNATTASSVNETSETVNSTTVSVNAATASSANETSETVNSTTVSVNGTSEAVNSASANVTRNELNASTAMKKKAGLKTSTTNIPMKTNATWPKSVTVVEQKLTIASFPPYIEMIKEAITSLNSKKGSSKGAILRYIMDNFNVGNNTSSVFDKMNSALLQGANVGELVEVYGVGSSVYFKLVDVTVPMPKTSETDVNVVDSVTMEVVH
uniref:H15 domain-containing protein n=1 Tax=Globodera pallida TaxID=36090 RepID=A0A183BNS3_GLOPA